MVCIVRSVRGQCASCLTCLRVSVSRQCRITSMTSSCVSCAVCGPATFSLAGTNYRRRLCESGPQYLDSGRIQPRAPNNVTQTNCLFDAFLCPGMRFIARQKLGTPLWGKPGPSPDPLFAVDHRAFRAQNGRAPRYFPEVGTSDRLHTALPLAMQRLRAC